MRRTVIGFCLLMICSDSFLWQGSEELGHRIMRRCIVVYAMFFEGARWPPVLDI